MGMTSSWRADLAAALALGAATLATCGPWVVLQDRTFTGRDVAFTWIAAEEAASALVHGPAGGVLAWPLRYPATNADVVLGEGILGALVPGDPLVRNDVIAVLGLLLTAWTAHRLARALTGPGWHTWIAGIMAGLGPLQVLHLQHVNLVHHEGVVLTGLFAGLALTGRPAYALGAGLAAATSWMFGVYLGLQATAVLGCVLVTGLVCRRGDRASFLALIAAFLVSLGAGWALTAPWRASADLYEIHVDESELRDGSWHLADTLAPLEGVALHAPLDAVWPPPSISRRTNPANPGYVAVGLAVAGAVRARRERDRFGWMSLGIVALAGGLLALGPAVAGLPGPWRLLQEGGLDGLRAPARWLWLSFAAFGPFAALAARELAARAGRWSPAVILGLLAALVAETPYPKASPFGEAMFEPVYAGIDGEGALYDEALRHDATCGANGSQALRAALFHGRPLIGGSYARVYPALAEVNRVAGLWPRTEAIDLFRVTGVTTVLEHPPLRTLPEGLECRESDGHRICRIPARPPIPDRVREGTDAPIVGFRWTDPPDPIVLRCGAVTETTSVAAWTAVAWARGGRPSAIDAYFERPCAAGASSDGGAPLVADGTDTWPPPPPPRRRSIADAPEIRDPGARIPVAPPPRRRPISPG